MHNINKLAHPLCDPPNKPSTLPTRALFLVRSVQSRDHELVVLDLQLDRVTVADRAVNDAPGERHHELLLDDPVERACAILGVVA